MNEFRITSAIDFKTYLNISFRTFYAQRVFVTIIVVFIILEAMLLLSSAIDWYTQCVVLAYFIGFYGVLKPLVIYVTCKANMKKTAALHESLLYTITEDKIEVRGETISSSSSWQYVTKVTEREKYFLIRTGAKAFHYLPKDGFESKEGPLNFREMVKGKGIKFAYN